MSPIHTAVSWLCQLHPNSVKALGAYDVCKPRERVWDMVIKQIVAQVFNPAGSCKSSHDVSDGNRQSKTCDFFALVISISTVFQLMTQDTSCSAHFSCFSTQTEILNFLVNQVSCDWILCCDWHTLHSAWRWTALWSCPRPFPSVRPCKTNIYQHLTQGLNFLLKVIFTLYNS